MGLLMTTIIPHHLSPLVELHWASYLWWSVATGARLIGTLIVVMREKGLGDFVDLLGGARQVHQQAFLPQRAMKSLDIRVQIGTMRRDNVGLYSKTQQEAY